MAAPLEKQFSLISGLEGASEGTVEVAGAPVDGIPDGVGYMFQTDAVLPWRSVVDNVGFPVSSINTTYGNSGTIGAADADILVSLNEKHHATHDYVRDLRIRLKRALDELTTRPIKRRRFRVSKVSAG